MLRLSCSLKAVARLVGLTPVEVDRARIHELPPALHAYVASDARLTRALAERRWPGAARASTACGGRRRAAVTPAR